MNRKWIAMGCLLVGVFAGAAGAQVIDAWQSQYLNSGLMTLEEDDSASFFVTLDDARSAPAARVRLQFFTEAGAVAAAHDAVLEPGQSAALQVRGPGRVRAHAQSLEPTLPLSARRELVGVVEVLNLTAKQRRPVCSIVDNGVDGGRQ